MNYHGRISISKHLSFIRLQGANSMTNMLRLLFFSAKTIKSALLLFLREFESMFLFRKATVIMTATVLMLSATSGTLCLAAQKSAGSSNKIQVPANIIKGSAVVSGRTFYKSNVPENTLAGIRLGRPAKEILAKWGNPTRITVGQSQGEISVTQTDVPAYTPPAGGQNNPLVAGVSAISGMLGLPQLPGPQAAPQTPAAPNETTVLLTEEEVTWTYDLVNGITLEFIITDGLITQITVGGSEPWSLSKTRMGLQLGDTYKLVLWVGGYPESQKYVGRFLRVSYVNKNRALFTFLNKRLVGITIAMVPSELD